MRRSIQLLTGLALLGLALAVGCRSSDPADARREAQDALRDYVRGAVTDADRQATALGLLDALDAELEALRADAEAFRAQVAELSPQKSTTREQLLAVYDEAATQRKARRGRVLDLHFQLREALTADEWPGYAERERTVLRASLPQPRTGAAAGATDEEG